MVGQLVGKPLLDYLNEHCKIKFTGIKVLNDTIASLFAGLTDNSYDAYIGLIVGTGTNMATFIPADKIKKLDPSYNIQGLVPVNLESGNFILHSSRQSMIRLTPFQAALENSGLRKRFRVCI